jgi:hypothetical protein
MNTSKRYYMYKNNNMESKSSNDTYADNTNPTFEILNKTIEQYMAALNRI